MDIIILRVQYLITTEIISWIFIHNRRRNAYVKNDDYLFIDGNSFIIEFTLLAKFYNLHE